MQGFVVLDYASQYPSARAELSQWLSEGKIKRKETIIKGKLLVEISSAPQTGMEKSSL
ncbi:hypothetical protein Q9189_006430 [Teloschistes chrysophthalmus]